MGSNDVEYRPYRLYVYGVFFLAVLGIVFFVGMGFFLSFGNVQDAFEFGVSAIIIIFFAKYLYDSSKAVVFFGMEGLRVINDGYRKHYYIPWENLSYAYYRRDGKRNLYLLLSQEALDDRQQKKIKNRCMLLSKVYIDNIIIIFISNAEETTKEVLQIEEIILEKILFVNTK